MFKIKKLIVLLVFSLNSLFPLVFAGISSTDGFADPGNPNKGENGFSKGQGTTPAQSPNDYNDGTTSAQSKNGGNDSAFFKQDLTNAPGVPAVEKKKYSKADFGDAKSGGGNIALQGIKNAINRVLGLLALIALIILIFQGVTMLINAKDSKKIEEGYTTVKNVAIALVFIGISWLIVSFIFWAIGVFTGP